MVSEQRSGVETVVYLVIRNVAKHCKFIQGWRATLHHFEILWA
jgi:hypothetical protein